MPVRQPASFNMEERQADTEPFPLVPAMCTNFKSCCGSDSSHSRFLMESRPMTLPSPDLCSRKSNAPSKSILSPESAVTSKSTASLKSIPASFLSSLRLTPSARSIPFCSLRGLRRSRPGLFPSVPAEAPCRLHTWLPAFHQMESAAGYR